MIVIRVFVYVKKLLVYVCFIIRFKYMLVFFFFYFNEGLNLIKFVGFVSNFSNLVNFVNDVISVIYI